MPGNLSIEFQGVRELRKALEQVPAGMRKSVYRTVISKGAQVVAKATKANARKAKDTGALTKSIGYSVSRDRTRAKIGARRGFDGPEGNPVMYAKNVEFGTSVAAANPYARPAIDSSEGQTIDTMARALDSGLDKEIAKAERKRVRR